MAVSNGAWYCRDNICANLNLPKGTTVYCYDLQGQPIDDFSNLQNGAHLLVTEDYFEDPLRGLRCSRRTIGTTMPSTSSFSTWVGDLAKK
jgi:hypothetical protein